MLKHLLPLLLLFPILLTCEGNTAARKTARGTNFVSDPDHLYFKNTRARHYAAAEITQRATIYRHGALFASAANLRPILIDNWLQDRAIIRFDGKAGTPDWKLETQQGNQWETIALSVPPTNEELADLHDVLLGKAELRIISSADTLPAFPDATGRAEARAVLNDYLRLVDFGR